MWVFEKLLPVGLDEEEREAEAEEVLAVFFMLAAAGARPLVSSDFGPEGDRWRVETTTTS